VNLDSAPVSRRRLVLIANPVAGGGRGARALEAACVELDRRGVPYRTLTTHSGGHAVQLAREAAEAGDETVVAVGGDGHVGSIAGVLRETGTPLAIVPAGRGNDLARVLRIPTDPAAAIAVALEGSPRPIDVGEVNGAPFLGIASLGFDSDANRIANESKWVRGNLVYVYAALRALAAWKPARFTLSLDGRQREFVGYSVGACNSRAYGGGLYAAPEALLDDGRFDVVWCEQMSKLRWLTRLLPHLFKGTHIELPEVRMERARQVRIDAERPFDIYADGDRIADLPAAMRIGEHQVRIIVPAAGGPP
jgi:YegS/Rv2252/BmrU family lipid kinase